MFIRLKLYAIGVASGLLALLAIYWSGRRAGVAAVRAAANEARLDNLVGAKKIEEEIDALDDSSVRSRASKWVRKAK
jgi:hypothetical protein